MKKGIGKHVWPIDSILPETYLYGINRIHTRNSDHFGATLGYQQSPSVEPDWTKQGNQMTVIQQSYLKYDCVALDVLSLVEGGQYR